MSYISLYRKYRPDTFDTVIGQDHIVRTLSGQVASGNVAHAYLFTGTRGTGKTSVARIFARAINCVSPYNGSPCQECGICQELSKQNSMDIIEIDAASNNSIDDIRDIRDKVKYPPTNAKYKVHIIDEVHQLSGAAFNGLLKTLEEPPEHAVFILATTESHKIPQTILSRCIKLDFRLVALDTLVKHISKIYDKENVKYDNEAVLAIARAGEGSVRDTLSVADMCMSYSDNDITYDKVLEVLGANNPSIIADIVDATLDGNLSKALEIIDNTASLGKSMPALARDITKFLRDLLIVKNVKSNKFLQLPDKIYERARCIADNFSSSSILRALEIVASVDMNMKYSTFPRVLLESAVSKAATYEGVSQLDLIAKVDNIEKKINSGFISNNVKKSDIKSESIADGCENIIIESKVQKITNTDINASNSSTTITKKTEIEVTTNNEELSSNSELLEIEEPDINYPADAPIKETDAEFKLRGALVNKLRLSKAVMLSIIISDKDNTNIDILEDNVVRYRFAKESDCALCERNMEMLKKYTDDLLEGEYKVVFECFKKKTEEDTLKNIVKLFGSSAVVIKNK